MSSATTIDFQIANTANLEKIERFMNATAYQDNIEYSSNFNTRLCVERRLRLPFFDPQTGVAQNHCSLFMARRQRMPGFRDGQIYSYPAARWRKHRRQYLTKMLRPFSSIVSSAGGTPSTHTNGSCSSSTQINRRLDYGQSGDATGDSDFNTNASCLDESSSLGATGTGDTSDSKDSQSHVKDELPKEWFYDDMEMNEIDGLEEPTSPPDDEYDYDPRYGSKKRKKRKPASQKSTRTSHHGGDGPRKGRPPGGGTAGGSRRGRRKAAANVSGGGGGNGSGSTSTSSRSSSKHIVEPPSPCIVEPPSFETAAAAVELANDDSLSGDLRSYRKYL